MFSDLTEDQLQGALEAMLFVTDEPVGVIELAGMLELDYATVEQGLMALRDKFEAEERGIQLREVAGGWRLFTHPAFHDLVERYVISWDTRRLSQAALETLAIVAYCQPITRSGVSAIRGVNSDSPINSLMEKGLLREAGTADAPGNPMQYATSRAFLERFGLRALSDLPEVTQFAPDEETRALICERLGATAGGDIPEEQNDTTQEQLDRLTDMQMRIVDEQELVEQEEAAPALAAQRDLLNAALASGLGLVEKIDFDSLKFEDDDE